MRKALRTALPVLPAFLFASTLSFADPMPAEDVLAIVGENKVVIHYHRFDGQHNQAGLWIWDERRQRQPATSEIFPAGATDFGVYFVINPSDFGNDDGPEDRIGFIPRLRRDWNFRDGTDRHWTPNLGREIWLIGNDPMVYTERPDISPKIAMAFIDADNRFTVTLSHPQEPAAVIPEFFNVTKLETGESIPVVGATPIAMRDGKVVTVDLQTGEKIDIMASKFGVSAEGFRQFVSIPRRALDDVERFFTRDPMGATWTPEKTTFRLFSPMALDVTLVLFDNAVGHDGRTEVPMTRRPDGVWETVVTGNLEGRHYRLRVHSERYGVNEINDPNATNTTGFDGHARITDLRAQDPEGFRPVRRVQFGNVPTDAIIYQIHIRDFTIDPSSGVSEAHRGLYLGLTEDNTHLPGNPNISTGLAHLREMGVTHVQIQPFQDFDNDESDPEYSWGYMTAFFNSPEGWFATKFRDETRIRETKKMIQSLNEANIGVILDVVYNHTGVQNTLELSAPGYWLRMRDDGSFWNGSGTGNEVRSEAPMVRRFIIDSLKFWMEEYGVDGFRFDLLGLTDMETVLQIQEELTALYPNVILYGEPWAATGPDGSGLDELTWKNVLSGSGFGAFNDHYRDNLKGSPDGDDPGFIVDGRRRQGMIVGIMGSIDDWAANPIESINYADVHDNLILHDKIKFSAPWATLQERERMHKLSGGILAVSQGIMLIHSGVEFMRTKQMNHNSYNAGDDINAVRWDLKEQHLGVVDWYRGVIAIRRNHPVFRLPMADQVRERFRLIEEIPAPETIAFELDGRGLEGETWERAVVLINPTGETLSFGGFGEDTFTVFAHDGIATPTGMGTVTAPVSVPGRSMTILGLPKN